MAVIRKSSCLALIVLLEQAVSSCQDEECESDPVSVSLMQTRMTHKATSEAWKHVLGEKTKRHRVLRSPTTGQDTPLDEFDMNVVTEGCGSICDTSQPVQHKSVGKYFDMIEKPVDCMALYRNNESDAPATAWPPPRQLPDALMRLYTMDDEAKTDDWYLQDKYSGGEAKVPVWTTTLIDKHLAAARSGRPIIGNYDFGSRNQIRKLLQQHATNIRGKHMMVIGSESPWLESLLLEAGARHVTTIEYGEIRSEDPRISTMTPDDVRRLFLASNGTQPRFDGGATFSSVEHSGLGRYGDRLNPWGDLQAMAKAWCITKASGPMFTGVPTNKVDHVHYNAHRVYGPKRYAHLMANYLQVEDQGESPFDRDCIQTHIDYSKTDHCEPQKMLAFVRGEDKSARP